MATVFAFLALLVVPCYFIHTRSVAMAAATNGKDRDRFMIANWELHLGSKHSWASRT